MSGQGAVAVVRGEQHRMVFGVRRDVRVRWGGGGMIPQRSEPGAPHLCVPSYLNCW